MKERASRLAPPISPPSISPDRGTQDETDPEGRADHAHPAGALVLRGDVGDVCRGDADVGCEGAGEQPGGEDPCERGGEPQQQQADGRPRDRHEHDATPADAVREPPPERRTQELRGRIGREDRPQGRGAGTERLGVEGKNRNRDSES